MPSETDQDVLERETSLVGHWLRLHLPMWGGRGLISSWGARIPHALVGPKISKIILKNKF